MKNQKLQKLVRKIKILEFIKSLFGLGQKGLIGLDIGLSAIKVAFLNQNGTKYKLTHYVSVPLPEASFIDDDIQKPGEIISAIKEAMKQLGLSIDNVCIGLFGPNTVVKKLQLASMSDQAELIKDQVIWEIEQYLPFSIEEASISHHVMGKNEGGGISVLVVAVRNDVLNTHKELVESAGFNVKVVDMHLTAITNVFEYVLEEKFQDPESSFLLMDIGAQKTEIIIYRNGAMVFSKEVNVGGVIFTEEIQRQMGVNYFEAEDLKITTDDEGNLPEEVLDIIEDVMENFFEDIQKTILFYRNSWSDETLKQCFITGGGILLPVLLDKLEELLEVKVSVLNPFDKIEYDSHKIDQNKIDEISYRGGVAIGLAMRSIEK